MLDQSLGAKAQWESDNPDWGEQGREINSENSKSLKNDKSEYKSWNKSFENIAQGVKPSSPRCTDSDTVNHRSGEELQCQPRENCQTKNSQQA